MNKIFFVSLNFFSKLNPFKMNIPYIPDEKGQANKNWQPSYTHCKRWAFFVIGYFVLAAVTIWVIYRIVKGWLWLDDGKPMTPYFENPV